MSVFLSFVPCSNESRGQRERQGENKDKDRERERMETMMETGIEKGEDTEDSRVHKLLQMMVPNPDIMLESSSVVQVYQNIVFNPSNPLHPHLTVYPCRTGAMLQMIKQMKTPLTCKTSYNRRVSLFFAPRRSSCLAGHQPAAMMRGNYSTLDTSTSDALSTVCYTSTLRREDAEL